MTCKAVILAAGKGTRMAQLTASRPKPMLEICGQPILEHIIVALRGAGIGEFVLITGYLAEVVENHFQTGEPLGVQIQYIRQQVQNGTGAAFHLAKEVVGQDPFFAGYGDIITSINNYRHLIQDFQKRPCDALLSLNWVEDPYRGAAVYMDENSFITNIIEKPPKGTSASHWNSAGLFVFSPLIFEYTAKLKPSARGEYEITDAIRAMITDKRQVRGFKLEGFWSDVGRPEDIETASRVICEQKVQ
jgi:UDP-N-acetylglucosamine diphosphorylase / glucose-1-phosphate thymidylyltransferase / UDP-N-acetylgalactosamine diphosphorylase / glucosamine-1-phosphate N-acetyltransferase / galactosamine-1-phosphate N-acetyltransferase